MNKKLCEICSQNEHKYRCPKCKIVYCSLNCFKSHKESCLENSLKNVTVSTPDDQTTQPADTENKNEITENNTTNEATTSAASTKESAFALESEDLASQESLKLLGESTELKQLLANKHLRDLLKTINETSEKSIDIQMDKAMQEPLFTEFADACLKIVQDKNELLLPTVKNDIDFKLDQ